MDNGWNEWSKFVLKELERLNSCCADMNNQLGKIREEISGLKVKASIWGAIGGVIPIIILLGIRFLEHK